MADNNKAKRPTVIAKERGRSLNPAEYVVIQHDSGELEAVPHSFISNLHPSADYNLVQELLPYYLPSTEAIQKIVDEKVGYRQVPFASTLVDTPQGTMTFDLKYDENGEAYIEQTPFQYSHRARQTPPTSKKEEAPTNAAKAEVPVKKKQKKKAPAPAPQEPTATQETAEPIVATQPAEPISVPEPTEEQMVQEFQGQQPTANAPTVNIPTTEGIGSAADALTAAQAAPEKPKEDYSYLPTLQEMMRWDMAERKRKADLARSKATKSLLPNKRLSLDDILKMMDLQDKLAVHYGDEYGENTDYFL